MSEVKINILEIAVQKFVNLQNDFQKGFVLGYMEGAQLKQSVDTGQDI